MNAFSKLIKLRYSKAPAIPAGIKNSFLLLFVLSIGLMAPSCEQNKEEVKRLQEEKQQLEKEIEQNKENVESYFSDLNEIEENLHTIKEKEGLISQTAGTDTELGVNQQDRITEDIQIIGELMEKNRNLIENLNNRLRNADTRISGFERLISRLKETIEEREIEIGLLKDQLAKMNVQVDFLTAKVDTLQRETEIQNQTIEQKTIELNTAWYAIGSRRELTDNDIVAREGGFLGLGRTEKLKADFNKDFFTRIDITRDSEITIFGNDPELITLHPSESYTIYEEDDVYYLSVLDAEEFWSASRYLVIRVK